MKTSYIIIIVITAVVFMGISRSGWEGRLASPNLVQIVVQKMNPNPVPNSSPGISGASLRVKTYHFDSSTNLKQELDTVDPVVLDSDFNE